MKRLHFYFYQNQKFIRIKKVQLIHYLYSYIILNEL